MSTESGMYKGEVVCIYNGILLGCKKNEIISFAAIWMDPEIIILNEVRQKKTSIFYRF